ncbi:MAG TPA: flagellar FlbD family protein [Polyangiaceae bacterium]|jgi:flagellar protein FlbD|nr:flagellar FlbD family protein [Polyangiaceae bacterium]
MIRVTRIKGQPVALNPELIEMVEEMPDTTIRLVSGENILVRESMDEIIELTVKYRWRIHYARAVSEPPPPTQRPEEDE